MTRLPPASYLDHLRSDSRRFRDVLADCDPDAAVPACPEWTASDLLWHLGEVQSFWGRVIRDRPLGPDDTWQSPARPEDVPGLLAFFDESSTALVTALEQADPAESAWSWAPEQTVGFTFRRQAHEALIHRLDAEQTAGEVTALDAGLAADGVSELVEVMYGGAPPEWAEFTPAGGTVELHLTDVGERLQVQPGDLAGVDPSDGEDVTGPHLVLIEADGDPAATVSGAAADLDAWLWRRRGDAGITVSGDRDSYDRFRAAVDQPLD